MRRIRQHWVSILVLWFIALGALARATIYGDLRLSIGMPDTDTFITSSRAPLLSWEAFTGRRLFTMNLLYKLIADPTTCQLTSMSIPASGIEGFREIQPCFDKIVITQSLLSIAGWSFLAWFTARRIKFAPYKIAVAIIILLFGLTPQIAEWDSVLSSESFSLSLYPIVLGLSIETVFTMREEGDQKNSRKVLLVSAWLVFFFLWIFIRDTHVYTILPTIFACIPFLFFARAHFRKTAAAAILILLGMFIIGMTSSKQSSRWQPSIIHVYDQYIAAYPARIEFFLQQGMPPDSNSEAYTLWLNEDAPGAYVLFLLSHPGFILTTIVERQAYFRSDFIQPYFMMPEMWFRNAFVTLGEVFHPETNGIYLLDFLILISLCTTAIRGRNQETINWAWLSLWIFLLAAISLFISYFGDVDGTRRHIFPSVEMFRLFCWIFLIVHMDLLTESARRSASIQPNKLEA